MDLGKIALAIDNLRFTLKAQGLDYELLKIGLSPAAYNDMRNEMVTQSRANKENIDVNELSFLGIKLEAIDGGVNEKQRERI